MLTLLLLANGIIMLAQGFYQNPVIRADVADPTIIRYGDTYYATGTSSEWAPFYPLFKSSDLVNWTQIGHIFNKQPEWTESSFWAPELFIYNNKVYCYYSARRKSDHRSFVGVAVADSPEGPFIDKGELITLGSECIDAYVFNDDGQLYISWKAYGLDPRPIELLCCKLSKDGLHLEGEPFSLIKDEGQIGCEGQCIFREGDWYYLLYAARGCCGAGSDYEVRVARSKSMTEPFVNYSDNPILKRSDDFLSCGHGTLVDTPDGRKYYLCHAYQHGAGFFMGRQPILQELVIGSDGWPHFLTGRLSTARQPMPFAGTEQKTFTEFRDDFKSNTLDVSWVWNYVYNNVKSETKGDGKLQLSGTPVKPNASAVLCQRTPSTDYNFAVTVANQGSSMRGLTLYGDNRNYVAFVVKNKKMQLLSVKDEKETVVFEAAIKQKSVRLQAEVRNGTMLKLGYDSGKGMQYITTEAYDASHTVPWDRVARPGIISAVNAQGKEKPAEFADFRMWSQE